MQNEARPIDITLHVIEEAPGPFYVDVCGGAWSKRIGPIATHELASYVQQEQAGEFQDRIDMAKAWVRRALEGGEQA